MSEKVKHLAPEIWQEIRKASNILLHCHPNPDADSVGGALALYHLLKGVGKKVAVIAGDSLTPSSLKHLPGALEIIQKNYFEIDSGLRQNDINSFDLFLILDSSNTDMVSKKGEVKFPPTLKTIVIDHHASNKGFGDINLVDDSYIATCQILFDLTKEWGAVITHDMAVCLLLGIYFDSGGFKYAKTTTSTFEAAAELAKIAPDFSGAIFEMENQSSPKKLEFEGLALSSIHTYFGNKVAISEVGFEDFKKHGIKESDMENTEISNKLKSAPGWEIGISFFETQKGAVNIGLRTRDAQKYDLSKLASSLGGGGHKAAAGATLKMPFETARSALLAQISQVFPELAKN